MKKSVFAFVVLAILASAIPASAQRVGYIPTTIDGWWYKIQGNQVMMLEADNLGLINQVQRQGYRSLGPDLRWNGNAYGVYTYGGFYPMYDRNMRPMGRREATITYGAIGAGVGYGVSGNLRGTVIGAAGGAIVALLTHRGNGNKQLDNAAMMPAPQGQDDVRVGPDGVPVMVGTRLSRQEAISNPPTAGEWRVSNRTSKRAELWDGDRFIVRIEPWQSTQVSAPKNGFKAVLLIPNRSGGLDKETAQIRSSNNFNGWDIVAPAVQ